jgi:hypothetical protein
VVSDLFDTTEIPKRGGCGRRPGWIDVDAVGVASGGRARLATGEIGDERQIRT